MWNIVQGQAKDLIKVYNNILKEIVKEVYYLEILNNFQ